LEPRSVILTPDSCLLDSFSFEGASGDVDDNKEGQSQGLGVGSGTVGSWPVETGRLARRLKSSYAGITREVDENKG